MNIGDKLLELRKKKGYSQEEAADKLGVTRQTISKWETEQSSPDFDKIVPICELYDISTEELLRGIKKESTSTVEKEVIGRKKSALTVALSILLYFIAVIWIIVSEEVLNIDDAFQVGGFLLICGIATIMLVYNAMITADKESEKKFLKKNKKIKAKRFQVAELILLVITLVSYFLVSFITGAWHITWIIWIIYWIASEIMEIVMDVENEDDE